MKNKFWNRFLTWNPHNSDGFTLVELIVVIAILAILAAVAVPAYNGYIEKANKVADEQLLAAVNKAFAAACVGNGRDMMSFNEETAKVFLKTNRVVDSIIPAAYNTDFLEYYAGNEDKQFTYIKALIFDNDMKLFVAVDMIPVSYGGGTIYLAPEDVEKLAGTTFVGADGLGVYGILDQVHNVTSMVGGSKMQQVYESDAFQETALLALGYTQAEIDAMTKAEMEDALGDKVAELAGKNGGNPNQIRANAAVLFAAQNATKISNDEITAILTNPGSYDAILGEFTNNNPTDGLAQASLVYGMYLAYAHSEFGNETAIGNAENPTDALKAWNNLMNPADGDTEGEAEKAKFLEYVNDDQYEKDLNGYLAALNMINSSTGDPAAVENLMINGFGDDVLAGLVKGELDKVTGNQGE